MTPKVAAKLLLVARSRAQRGKLNAVHAAADAHLDTMHVAVAYAFMKGRKAVDKSALKSAMTERDAMAAMDAVPGAVKAALLTSLPKPLIATLGAGGQAGASRLTGLLKAASYRAAADSLTMKFDVSNPNAVKWAAEHAGDLAKGLSDTTRDDIKDAISHALDGDGIASAYDDILAAVGDDTRADMIARTETMTAANEGNRQSWGQAVDTGLLSADSKREWIAAEDCCDDCDDLDGVQTDLDGEYPDDGGDGPPLHPNCRCTEGISA